MVVILIERFSPAVLPGVPVGSGYKGGETPLPSFKGRQCDLDGTVQHVDLGAIDWSWGGVLLQFWHSSL